MEEVFVISGETHEDVKQQLTDARDQMKELTKQFSMHTDGAAMEV